MEKSCTLLQRTRSPSFSTYNELDIYIALILNYDHIL